ncbi:hypothetical protein EYF80_054130 [Liparis tanakae]|uniref:Uncharacterized protein n=1 Tax=Liparis tanakae TaxID=230148 RepID=A0A4Z2F3T2_9TELE|nr:hypothetical protein EYF80_054130 [Liparis tanakae]
MKLKPPPGAGTRTRSRDQDQEPGPGPGARIRTRIQNQDQEPGPQAGDHFCCLSFSLVGSRGVVGPVTCDQNQNRVQMLRLLLITEQKNNNATFTKLKPRNYQNNRQK